MTGATVSVVIATRDRWEMLREAIDHVVAQDYPGPVEVVVVADQSEPDRTLTRDDPHRRVRVVTNRHRPGLAGARNTGIEASTGELVAFCDDDDLWRPAKLRLQLAALADHPRAGLCTAGITIRYAGEEFDRRIESGLVRFADLLLDRHTELHPSTFLMRRSLLDEIGLVDENVPGGFGEDYELLLRAARVHDIVNVPEPLAFIRWGQQSFFFRRWETMAEGLSWLLDRYPEFERSPAGSARVRGQVAFAHAALGDRGTALRWSRGAWRRNPREPRIYLALAVALRLVSPDRVMQTLHRHGKGI